MNNQWTEVCITVPQADTDRASDIANMLVPYGLYIEDYSDLEQGARDIAHIDLIDEDLLAKDRTHSLIHIYLSPEDNPAEALAFLQERLTANGIANEVVTTAISEEDWANNWKQYFKPLKIGEKLLICPTWDTVDDAEGRTVLNIDPGMAFGTGGHETTRLVLEAMETVITPDTDLLDVGCGSGILSLAALLLGARSALAVDIDALAVKTAIENGERSGLTPPRYTVVEGDLVDKVSGQFDLVVANIVADAIIMLSPAVKPFVKENGVYIVSGIIDTREAEVVEALNACGFVIEHRFEQRGWLCMVCKHR
ncbi:MAG: 50S ribosomal protein L11 methyltransferase [Ruminococcaceae bacterium]|nr:50S ribosomal protein L11 methyltransferase [Oscillospiraceae bacterium]